MSTEFTPIQVADYVPAVVRRLLARISAENFQRIALYGFSDNMKWIFRLLQENGRDAVLCDWRPKFIAYDCGGQQLVPVDSLSDDTNTLLVVCVEEINDMKAAMRYLLDKDLTRMPAIYDRADPHRPFAQEQPYKGIADRARARARSMISDAQLFDLIQFMRMTADVPGDVVEYGSLHGGSGAVLAEALNHYGKKPLYLLDSFEGIPQSKYGLDHRWNGAFSNNSFQEVKAAFADLDNVTVVRGNIVNTYDATSNPLSFGYLASDTLESGELLLNYMWPKLSRGGILAVCDYGSYPNCVPLTVACDRFFENKKDAMIYYPDNYGIFVVKR
jgi:hypothetical protein